jgi:hypothetical protein
MPRLRRLVFTEALIYGEVDTITIRLLTRSLRTFVSTNPSSQCDLIPILFTPRLRSLSVIFHEPSFRNGALAKLIIFNPLKVDDSFGNLLYLAASPPLPDNTFKTEGYPELIGLALPISDLATVMDWGEGGVFKMLRGLKEGDEDGQFWRQGIRGVEDVLAKEVQRDGEEDEGSIEIFSLNVDGHGLSRKGRLPVFYVAVWPTGARKADKKTRAARWEAVGVEFEEEKDDGKDAMEVLEALWDVDAKGGKEDR